LGNLSLCVCLFECKEQDQFNGLDTFHQLLKELTTNKATCVKLGLLTILLDWFAMEQIKICCNQIGANYANHQRA